MPTNWNSHVTLHVSQIFTKTESQLFASSYVNNGTFSRSINFPGNKNHARVRTRDPRALFGFSFANNNITIRQYLTIITIRVSCTYAYFCIWVILTKILLFLVMFLESLHITFWFFFRCESFQKYSRIYKSEHEYPLTLIFTINLWKLFVTFSIEKRENSVTFFDMRFFLELLIYVYARAQKLSFLITLSLPNCRVNMGRVEFFGVLTRLAYVSGL